MTGRHEIELILFGVALAKTERTRVLEGLPPGYCSQDIEPLFDALRTNKPEAVIKFLDERGIVAGKDIIQTMIVAATEWGRRERMENMLVKMQQSKKYETTEQMRARMLETLKEIEEMQ
jgi:hypothetical protein